jgi:hypothetical protein
VGTTFPPVSNGTVRVEATVSFDRLIDGFFLQTSVSVSEAVVTRLIVLSDGSVRDDFSRTLLGQYEANTPFRVRMDIDMTVDRWSVALDDELNGFDDDPVISDLPFENPSSVLPSVSVVHASFDVFPVRPIGGSIAYDDIAVLCPDGMTSVSRDTWGSVKLRYR